MLSRRIVVQGLAVVTAGLSWRPAWAVSGGAAALVPVAVSPDMVDLANLWEAIGRKYDETKHRRFTSMVNRGQLIDAACPDYKRWEKVKERLLHATTVVLREPAQSEGDAIFKYHVIDMHTGWRPVDNWAWTHAKGWELSEVVRREAEQFGVAINPFWYKMPSALAMIDGDEHSPRWAVISQWRLKNSPAYMYEAYERALAGTYEMDTESMRYASEHLS
jgi:hypothetical protein